MLFAASQRVLLGASDRYILGVAGARILSFESRDIDVVKGQARLFRERSHPLALRPIECTPTTTGVLLLTYQPA